MEDDETLLGRQLAQGFKEGLPAREEKANRRGSVHQESKASIGE